MEYPPHFRPQWPQPLGGCGLSGRCPQRRAAVCPHLSSSGRRPPGGREGNSTQQETHSKAGEVQLGPSPTPASSTEKKQGDPVLRRLRKGRCGRWGQRD